jgi:glycosyltransferase involved in cell wall biosynthesis
LAKAISKVISNRAASLAIGRENRRIIKKKFTWDKNVQRLHGVYKEFP